MNFPTKCKHWPLNDFQTICNYLINKLSALFVYSSFFFGVPFFFFWYSFNEFPLKIFTDFQFSSVESIFSLETFWSYAAQSVERQSTQFKKKYNKNKNKTINLINSKKHKKKQPKKLHVSKFQIEEAHSYNGYIGRSIILWLICIHTCLTYWMIKLVHLEKCAHWCANHVK